MTSKQPRRRQVLAPTFNLDEATAPSAPTPSPAGAEPPTADPEPTSPATAPERAEPPPGSSPAAQPPARYAMSDSASTLASLLAGSGEPDTENGGEPGAGALIDALLTPPRPDPDMDLVNPGTRYPRHFDETIRMLAFARRAKKQDIFIEATRLGLMQMDRQTFARARHAAGGGQ